MDSDTEWASIHSNLRNTKQKLAQSSKTTARSPSSWQLKRGPRCTLSHTVTLFWYPSALFDKYKRCIKIKRSKDQQIHLFVLNFPEADNSYWIFRVISKRRLVSNRESMLRCVENFENQFHWLTRRSYISNSNKYDVHRLTSKYGWRPLGCIPLQCICIF